MFQNFRFVSRINDFVVHVRIILTSSRNLSDFNAYFDVSIMFFLQKTDIIYNLYITILMPCFDISSSVSFLLIATFMQYMYVCRPDIGIFFLWKQLSSQPLGYFLRWTYHWLKNIITRNAINVR